MVDLRRAKVVDGKFLTGLNNTLSIVGSKLIEQNLRIYQDKIQPYSANPLNLYVTC